MHVAHTRWLLSGLLLVASVATASGQVVYKWKDSGGNVHFTDTPPPPGVTLLKGPKPASVAEPTSARDDKPMLRQPCRPDNSAAECDSARRSLQADLEDLERTYPQVQRNLKGTVSGDESKRQLTANRASECSMSRNVIAKLHDRQTGRSTKILTVEDRAEIPAQIAEAERWKARSCNQEPIRRQSFLTNSPYWAWTSKARTELVQDPSEAVRSTDCRGSG